MGPPQRPWLSCLPGRGSPVSSRAACPPPAPPVPAPASPGAWARPRPATVAPRVQQVPQPALRIGGDEGDEATGAVVARLAPRAGRRAVPDQAPHRRCERVGRPPRRPHGLRRARPASPHAPGDLGTGAVSAAGLAARLSRAGAACGRAGADRPAGLRAARGAGWPLVARRGGGCCLGAAAGSAQAEASGRRLTIRLAKAWACSVRRVSSSDFRRSRSD